jgi:hypothetical protein
MMTWFREQGCRLRLGLCYVAAVHGHLVLLMWLRENGCPVDLHECADRATRGGHNEVVAWLGQFTDETWHTGTN